MPDELFPFIAAHPQYFNIATFMRRAEICEVLWCTRLHLLEDLQKGPFRRRRGRRGRRELLSQLGSQVW